MSRLVRSDPTVNKVFKLSGSPVARLSGTILGSGAPSAPNHQSNEPTDIDNYAVRIVKYVPTEVTAFYLAADKLFLTGSSSVDPSEGLNAPISKFIDSHTTWIAFAIFVFALIATPVYVAKQAETQQPYAVNAVMATIAFVIWSYTAHGNVFAPIFDGRIACLAILIFTVISGFVVPGVGKAEPGKHDSTS